MGSVFSALVTKALALGSATSERTSRSLDPDQMDVERAVTTIQAICTNLHGFSRSHDIMYLFLHIHMLVCVCIYIVVVHIIAIIRTITVNTNIIVIVIIIMIVILIL